MTSLKKKIKKKKFSNLPTLIFLDMSLETHIFFFFCLTVNLADTFPKVRINPTDCQGQGDNGQLVNMIVTKPLSVI